MVLVEDVDLHRHGARCEIDGLAEPRHLSRKGLSRKGVNSDCRLTFRRDAGDVTLQDVDHHLHVVQIHQGKKGGDHGGDHGTGVERPPGNDAGKGGDDPGVVEPRRRNIEGCGRDLHRCLRILVVLFCDEALFVQILRPVECQTRVLGRRLCLLPGLKKLGGVDQGKHLAAGNGDSHIDVHALQRAADFCIDVGLLNGDDIPCELQGIRYCFLAGLLDPHNRYVLFARVSSGVRYDNAQHHNSGKNEKCNNANNVLSVEGHSQGKSERWSLE